MHGGLKEKIKINDFVHSMREHDVVLLSETWSSVCSDVDLDGYKRMSKLRISRKGTRRASGGLEVYVKEGLFDSIKEVVWDNEDGLCMQFDKQFFNWDKDLILFFVYMIPSNSSRNDINTEEDCYDRLFNKLASVNKDSMKLACGDFNARIGTKMECTLYDANETHVDVISEAVINEDTFFSDDDFVLNNMSINRVNADPVVNDYGLKLLRVCNSCDLAVLNGRTGGDRSKGETTFCGRQGESTIDFVLVDNKVINLVADFNISKPSEFSDHKMLSFKLKCKIKKDENDETTPDFLPAKRDKKGKDRFIEHINSDEIRLKTEALLERLDSNLDRDLIDSVLQDLTEIMTGVSNGRQTEKGRVKVQTQGGKWYDKECKSQQLVFFEARATYFDNKSDDNRVRMCKERSKYRKMCRQKKGGYNRQEAELLVELSKKDPKRFWKKIKGDRKKTIVGNCDFYSHFKELASRENRLEDIVREEIVRINEHYGATEVDELDKNIDFVELNSAIKDLSKNKATGHDQVLNEFIINSPTNIRYLILMLFNSILTLEYFPEKWSIGSIIPIFKSGDKNVSNNYRGITLLSCLGKLFTKVMNKRLNSWAENHVKLNEAQYGFRRGRGTVDCLFILHGIIEMMLARGRQLYAVFVDYEKAYDYLDRGAIWAKLLKGGVSSKCIRLFRNMYDKMKLEMRGDNRYFESTLGILQGEITSPLFFSFFVRDLEDNLSEEAIGISVFDVLIKLLMYADDMVLFSETKEGLQEGLNNLHDYCSAWGLTLNATKTKVVVFRKGGRLSRNCVFEYGRTNIEIVSYFKYLGIYFSTSGSFSYGIQELVKSARRALFCLKKCISNNPEITAKMQIDLFNTMVAPILFYGNEVWGFCKAEPIERFHLAFLKSLLCVKSSTPNCFVYGELGVYPLHVERKYRIIKFWLKILNSSTDSYMKKIYLDLLMFNVDFPGKVTWVSLLKKMLFEYGFGDVWMWQYVGNDRLFLSQFRQRLYDVYKQEWRMQISETSQHRLYMHIKQDFCFESYLSIVNKELRIHISKLRLSSHLFLVERGRWVNRRLNIEDRLCALCNVREDEYHCMVECPRFVKERKNLLPVSLKNRPSMFEFINFIKCNEKNIMLGQLCLNVMKQYKKNYV